jgi:hypothetical protein
MSLETRYLTEEGKEADLPVHARAVYESQAIASQLLRALPEEVRAAAHLPLINAVHEANLRPRTPQPPTEVVPPRSPFAKNLG